MFTLSLTIIKLRERSHSFAGFSTYVTRNFIEKYNDKNFAMSQPVLPVNEFDVLNTTKYNFNQLNTFILTVILLMCAPHILQFCPTDNLITMCSNFVLYTCNCVA